MVPVPAVPPPPVTILPVPPAPAAPPLTVPLSPPHAPEAAAAKSASDSVTLRTPIELILREYAIGGPFIYGACDSPCGSIDGG